MSDNIRQLYVMINPALPGMVKVGMTTVGANERSRGLSSAIPLPDDFQVHGYVELPSISQSDLRELEQEALKRLVEYRHSSKREFFTVSPDQALAVLREVAQEARRYRSQGLTVTGKPQQPILADTPPSKTRDQQRREARLDQKARMHWHVWVEAERNDGRQVIGLNLDTRNYWSKSGAVGRVKREASRQTHAGLILCQDTACPAYGKRRTEI